MILLLSLLSACQSAQEVSAPAPQPMEAVQTSGLAQGLVVEAARIRLMPPGVPNTGGFLTLTNPGPDTALVAAHSDIARVVELHTHAEEGGMMRMRQLQELPLPSGQPVVLEPGGLHLMFIGLRSDLSEGQQVPVRLELADGSSVEVQIPVQAIEVGH